MASRVSSGRVMRNFTPTTAFSFDCAILRPPGATTMNRLPSLPTKSSDLAICSTAQPIFAAASGEVGVLSGSNSRAFRPLASSTAFTLSGIMGTESRRTGSVGQPRQRLPRCDGAIATLSRSRSRRVRARTPRRRR